MWGKLYVCNNLLSVQVEISLSETETMWLLDIPSTCVALDTEEAEVVKKNNAQYEMVRTARMS